MSRGRYYMWQTCTNEPWPTCSKVLTRTNESFKGTHHICLMTCWRARQSTFQGCYLGPSGCGLVALGTTDLLCKSATSDLSRGWVRNPATTLTHPPPHPHPHPGGRKDRSGSSPLRAHPKQSPEPERGGGAAPSLGLPRTARARSHAHRCGRF